MPLLVDDVELADDQGDQVGSMGLVLQPVKGDGVRGRIGVFIDQFAVGEDVKTFGHRDDHLARLLLVGLIEARDPVAIRDRLALAPDHQRHFRVRLGRAEEIQAGFGLAHTVVDAKRGLMSRGPGGLEVDGQVLAIAVERGRLPFGGSGADRHFLDFEADGIEPNRLQPAAALAPAALPLRPPSVSANRR